MEKYKILEKFKVGEYYLEPSTSYEELVKMCFDDVDWFFEEYEGSYQGDLYMLGKKDNKYYFFTISYGSCSGCDWLESIKEVKELGELVDEIFKTTVIKNKNKMTEFLSKFNWNDWLYDDDRVEKKLRKSLEVN